MKQNKKQLAFAMVLLGGVLLALRLRLYIVAVDEKNLLMDHWLSPVIWAVAGLTLVYGVICALGTKEMGCLAVTGPIAALGDGLFALTMVLSLLAMDKSASVLETVRMALGWISAASLLWAGVCRAKGKPVFFGCFCVIGAFFALYLVGTYRSWSASPQLQDYVFSMAALVGVTLFAYQNAALAVGIGSYRVWLASAMLTIAFGLAAVYGGSPMLLYFGPAVWTLTGLLGEERTEEL